MTAYSPGSDDIMACLVEVPDRTDDTLPIHLVLKLTHASCQRPIVLEWGERNQVSTYAAFASFQGILCPSPVLKPNLVFQQANVETEQPTLGMEPMVC